MPGNFKVKTLVWDFLAIQSHGRHLLHHLRLRAQPQDAPTVEGEERPEPAALPCVVTVPAIRPPVCLCGPERLFRHDPHPPGHVSLAAGRATRLLLRPAVGLAQGHGPVFESVFLDSGLMGSQCPFQSVSGRSLEHSGRVPRVPDRVHVSARRAAGCRAPIGSRLVGS